MMKKTFQWMLMAAVVWGLGMSVTACSDDDDKDGRSAEEIAQDPYDKQSEAADALYRLLSQLSVCDSLTDDWKTATFEPRLGQVLDQSQPRVRTITVNDAAEAVVRYNSLTGKNLPASTTSDTYKVDGVGSLTLNVGGAGTVATIDVDVKQIPQLQQLRMVTPASIGENGRFKGEPYYSFGDVVKDKDGCHWICVRPAYSPNGKEDTHWMSFQLNERKNVKTYTKSKCQEQVFPVDLGVQKEKMQYLAQLMAILANPEGYRVEAGQQGNYFKNHTTGLGGLMEAAMPVDSLVCQAELWNSNGVWEMVAPSGLKNDEDGFKRRFRENALRFIYEKGSTSGTKLYIPTATYNDVEHFYKQDPTYDRVTVDMRETAFNIENYSTTGEKDSENSPVDDAFVVRYKTGFQLSSNWVFTPKPTDSIPGAINVHRFKTAPRNNGGNEQPGGEEPGNEDGPVTLDKAKVGMLIGQDGMAYKTVDAATNNHTTAAAMIVYMGGNKRVERGKDWNGLAIDMNDIKGNAWSGEFAYMAKDEKKYACTHNAPDETYMYWYRGYSATQQMIKDGHDHPGAAAVAKLPKLNNGNFSEWFIASTGQWCLAMEGLGNGKYIKEKSEYEFEDKNLFPWDETGSYTSDLSVHSAYMTSTEMNNEGGPEKLKGDCWAFVYRGTYYPSIFKCRSKGDKTRIRPFLAFKYGNGGTEDFVEPWKSVEKPVPNGAIGKDGLFYASVFDAFAVTGVSPAAYILYVSPNGKTVDVGGKKYSGYALALCIYNDENWDFGNKPWDELNNLATSVKTTLSDDVRQKRGFSDWFMPSLQQWKEGLEQAFGVKFGTDYKAQGQSPENGTWVRYVFSKYESQGLLNCQIRTPFWTSTELESDKTKAYVIDLRRDFEISFMPVSKKEESLGEDNDKETICMRPFIAF